MLQEVIHIVTTLLKKIKYKIYSDLKWRIIIIHIGIGQKRICDGSVVVVGRGRKWCQLHRSTEGRTVSLRIRVMETWE
jgi:hypothetical protein